MLLKKIAYKIVYDDLMKCNICKGIYDAKHGTDSFMHGISLVMEAIAYQVNEKTLDEFNNIFMDNMIASKEKYND